VILKNGTEEYKINLIVKQKSPETIRGYMNDLTSWDRFLSTKYNCPTYLEDLTTEDIESYLEMLQFEKNYAVASINRNLNSIRSFCQYAYKKGFVKKDVSKDIESLKREQKERNYLTDKELKKFLPAIPHKLIQLAARTMAYSGLRVSEITNLTVENVDLENNLIYVIEGKGKKDRTVPISKVLKPNLVDYVENWRVKTDSKRFFATKKTGELSQQYINRVLKETSEALNWKKVTAHTLRHSFASNLVAKDVNIAKISKILGHSDLKTTSIYIHLNKKELSKAVDLLG
jgi:site-specific recombinase XerD